MRALTPSIFVPYEAPLQRGLLLDRRDRFIATVKLDENKQDVDVHCINPGRMEAFVDTTATVWVLPAPEATAETRKLKHSWEAIEQNHAIDDKRIMCGTNTQRPNKLVRALLEARCLPGLDVWKTLKPEAKFDVATADGEQHTGRADFLLDGDAERKHYIEVKNCHLVYPDGWGYFPDSVSERAARHVQALAALVNEGHQATVILVVQREDCVHGVRPSAWHDPTFAKAADDARKAGVSFRAIAAEVTMEGTRMTHELEVDTEGALDEQVIAEVGGWCKANRPTTGWTRSQSGQRVANKPFPHERKAVGGSAGVVAPATVVKKRARVVD